MSKLTDSPNFLFSLWLMLDGKRCWIDAYESVAGYSGTHTRIDVAVKHGKEVVFPLGSLYCGIPSGQSIDGNFAKETVLALVEMKPGDTDSEYFESYSIEQTAWAEKYGEQISMERERRYCDEDGNLK